MTPFSQNVKVLKNVSEQRKIYYTEQKIFMIGFEYIVLQRLAVLKSKILEVKKTHEKILFKAGNGNTGNNITGIGSRYSIITA